MHQYRIETKDYPMHLPKQTKGLLEKLSSDDDLTAYQKPQPLGLFNLPEPKPQGLLSTHAWEIFDAFSGK
jgi:hypothetical protein